MFVLLEMLFYSLKYTLCLLTLVLRYITSPSQNYPNFPIEDFCFLTPCPLMLPYTTFIPPNHTATCTTCTILGPYQKPKPPICYQSTTKPNHIKVHDYSNILGPFRKHTVKMIRGHRSNSRDFKHNFCKREGPRAINWKLVIPPKNLRFPSSEGGFFLQIMTRKS